MKKNKKKKLLERINTLFLLSVITLGTFIPAGKVIADEIEESPEPAIEQTYLAVSDVSISPADAELEIDKEYTFNVSLSSVPNVAGSYKINLNSDFELTGVDQNEGADPLINFTMDGTSTLDLNVPENKYSTGDYNLSFKAKPKASGGVLGLSSSAMQGDFSKTYTIKSESGGGEEKPTTPEEKPEEKPNEEEEEPAPELSASEFNVTVNWVDNDNEKGKRPTSINVNLFKNGDLFKEITIQDSETDGWKGKFEDIPIEDPETHDKYVYTYEATNNIDSYDLSTTVNENNINIVYTYNEDASKDKVKFVIKKQWVQSVDTANSLLDTEEEIEILQNGDPYKTVTVKNGGKTGKVTAKDGKHPISEDISTAVYLPYANEEGVPYKYTVKDPSEKEGEQAFKFISTDYEEKLNGEQQSVTALIRVAHISSKTMKAKKVWNDAEFKQYDLRSKISFNLLGEDGEVKQTVEVNGSNDEDTVNIDFNGIEEAVTKDYVTVEEPKYTIQEETSSLYISTVKTDDSATNDYDKTVITNTINQDYEKEVKLTLNWIGDIETERPTSATVEVYASVVGQEGEVLAGEELVTASNEWVLSGHYPAFSASGKLLSYHIRPKGKIKGYQLNIVDNTGASNAEMATKQDFTFDLVRNGKRDITIVKEWGDAHSTLNGIAQGALRPNTVKINLFANGNKVGTLNMDSTSIVGTMPEGVIPSVPNAEYMVGVFKDMPIYDDETNEQIEYTVTEDEITPVVNRLLNYKTPKISYVLDPSGYLTQAQVFNELEPEVTGLPSSVKRDVKIIWHDAGNKYTSRPSSVTANIALTQPSFWSMSSANQSSANEWVQSTSLDLITSEGAINYGAKPYSQDVPEGYKVLSTEELEKDVVEVKGKMAKDYSVTFHNVLKSLLTDITGQASWEDFKDNKGTRPSSIQVRLLKNGNVYKEKTVEPDLDGNWKYTFEDVLTEDDNGNKNIYTIEQVAIANYTTEYNGYNIVNILDQTAETVSLSGVKTWDDQDNKLSTRPSQVLIDVYQNGERLVDKQITVTPTDGVWNYKLDGLPKFDPEGELFVYTIKEVPVEGYSSTVSGTNITNKYDNNKTTEKPFKIKWVDESNKLDKRPDSIKVGVMVEGKIIDTMSINVNKVSNDESYSFLDLPMYDFDLNLREYSLTYISGLPDDYSFKIIDNETIEISYLNKEVVSVKGSKLWVDKSDKLEKRPATIKVNLLANSDIIATKELNTVGADIFTYEFTNLPMRDNKLNEIVYTVDEEPVEGYSKTVSGTNIINTYDNVEETSFNGTKAWNDQNNKLKARPSKIKVTLLQNKIPYRDMDLYGTDASDIWNFSFQNLPKYDENFDKYVYTIDETEVSGYSKEIVDNLITNTYINDKKTQVTGLKTWDDEDDKLGVRPKEIVISLYQNGNFYGTTTAKKDNGWSYSFNDLPFYNSTLDEYKYTIKETPVNHYSSEISGYNIKNTYVNSDTVTLNGVKLWEDNNNKLNKRPTSIQVSIYQDDSKSPLRTETVTADQYGDWRYSFKNLPKYRKDLSSYKYSVKEEPVSGYKSTVSGNNIVNTLVVDDKVTVSGTKTWVDKDNKLGTRPSSIDVYLTRGGVDYKKTTVTPVNGEWKYEFTNLDKYDSNFNEYVYTIREAKVDDYTVTTDGINLVNTYKNSKLVQVMGEKVWDDQNNKLNLRPTSVKIDLYRDGDKIKTATVAQNDSGRWGYSFLDLPKYNSNGLKEYVYTVKEQEVKGYTSTVNGYTITNKIKNDFTTDIKLTKVWEDQNNKLNTRPDTVNIRVLQNGIPYTTKTLMVSKTDKTQTLDIMNLPKYNSALVEYKYTFEEDKVSNYEADINGYTITNTYTNPIKTSVSGLKLWEDNDNALGLRPSSIQVKLKRGSEVVATTEATRVGNWKYSFNDLPKYDKELVEYKYTVEEVPVDRYDSKVEGTTITNTFNNSDSITVRGEKTWVDEDNKLGTRPSSIKVTLMQNTTEYAEVEVKPNEEGRWQYEFKDVPRYDNKLKDYTYTVKETSKIKGYKSETNKMNLVNTYVSEETVEMSGEKTWKDEDNKLKTRPDSITVYILQNGKRFAEKEVKPDKDGKWLYTFTDLPKYNKELALYKYTVAEAKVKDYVSTVDGMNLSNKLELETKIDITVNKVWEDKSDKLKKRPSSISVNLLQNGKEFKSETLSASSGWKLVMKDLPKYDEKLQEIKYSIKEDKVTGYSSSVNGFTITNKLDGVDEKVKVDVTKKWDDKSNKLGKRPSSIQVKIMNSGTEVKSLTLTGAATADTWTGSEADLPKYDESLNEIKYTVKEVPVEGYSSSIDGNTITNKLEKPKDTIKVEGTKTWKDSNNKLLTRPSSIIVNILQNGKDYKSVSVSANPDGTWKYSIDLPKYDDDLNENKYSIKESSVEGYSSVVNGFNLENTYQNKKLVTVQGIITWQDNDDSEKQRPNTVKVKLYQNGKEFKTQMVANVSNKWIFNFKDLPKYDSNLNEYKYTVDEDKVKEYEKEIVGFNILNRHRLADPNSPISGATYNKNSGSGGITTANYYGGSSSSNGSYLPRTGETRNKILVVIGLVVLILVISFLIYKAKKSNQE